MTFLLILVILLHILKAECLYIEPTDNILWSKNSKPLIVTCFSDREALWYKDGDLVESSDDVILQKYRTVSRNKEQHWTRLTVSKAAKSDSGNYSCSDGKQQRHLDIRIVRGQLKIHSAARITTFVRNPISLICEYEGDNKLNVKWHRDDNEQLASSGFISNRRTFSNGLVKTRLQISKDSLTLSDTASYYCVAGPFTRKVTMEVLKDNCNERLLNDIADDHITASSYYKDIIHDDSPRCARINQSHSSCGGWSPIKTNSRQWIQVSFSTFKVVKAVITLGRTVNDSRQEWVQTYRLSYSQDGISWNKYKHNGPILEFNGNFDKSTEVTTKLPVPIVAKFLRLHPTSWHGHISLRFDVLGCLLPTDIQITNENIGKLNLHVPDTLEVTCRYSGPEKPDIVWYKDDVRLISSAGFVQTTNTTWLNDRVESISTLKKTMTTYTDSGRYMCVDRTSRQNKSVTVYAAQLEMKPKFKRLWIFTHSRLQISCEYTGIHSKQITWTKADRNLHAMGFSVITNTNVMKGISKTTSNLTKDDITVNDGGNITCTDGDLVRQVEVIVVAGKVGPQILHTNQPLTLKCDISDLDKKYKLDFYWTKNYIPVNLVDSMKGKYEYSDNARRLTIVNADMDDAGHYECNVLLEVGSSQQQHLTVPIEVFAKSKIILEGQDEIKTGETLHLYCKVSGYPLPTVEWYKDGVVLTGDDSRINFLAYGGTPNGHFILFNGGKSDEGIYECKGLSKQFQPVNSEMVVKIKVEQIPENLLMIGVVVACTVLIIMVICCAVCYKCRSERNKPVRRDPNVPMQIKPLLTKRYVDMHVITRNKNMTSLEEIDRLPPPPPPIDSEPWDDNSTIEGGSLTYERIPRIRERQSM